MPYATKEEYYNVFGGEPVDETDFPSFLARAAELVEEMCLYRITEQNLSAYPEDTQRRVKKAVCAQIEYLEANGGSEMDNNTDPVSAGLGKFNYTKASAPGAATQSAYAPRALRILAPTGLLHRGGGCH